MFFFNFCAAHLPVKRDIETKLPYILFWTCMSEIRNGNFDLVLKYTTVTKITFVVAYIIFKVAVITSSLAKITFVVAEITFKITVITSPVVKITFLVAEITFKVVVITSSVIKITFVVV